MISIFTKINDSCIDYLLCIVLCLSRKIIIYFLLLFNNKDGFHSEDESDEDDVE